MDQTNPYHSSTILLFGSTINSTIKTHKIKQAKTMTVINNCNQYDYHDHTYSHFESILGQVQEYHQQGVVDPRKVFKIIIAIDFVPLLNRDTFFMTFSEMISGINQVYPVSNLVLQPILPHPQHGSESGEQGEWLMEAVRGVELPWCYLMAGFEVFQGKGGLYSDLRAGSQISKKERVMLLNDEGRGELTRLYKQCTEVQPVQMLPNHPISSVQKCTEVQPVHMLPNHPITPQNNAMFDCGDLLLCLAATKEAIDKVQTEQTDKHTDQLQKYLVNTELGQEVLNKCVKTLIEAGVQEFNKTVGEEYFEKCVIKSVEHCYEICVQKMDSLGNQIPKIMEKVKKCQSGFLNDDMLSKLAKISIEILDQEKTLEKSLELNTAFVESILNQDDRICSETEALDRLSKIESHFKSALEALVR